MFLSKYVPSVAEVIVAGSCCVHEKDRRKGSKEQYEVACEEKWD